MTEPDSPASRCSVRWCLLLPLLLCSGCASAGRLQPDEHVVAAPISERAGIVLGQLVAEGMVGDTWANEMSDGCAAIWATQFGYCAGLRRDRQDLILIGDLAADAEASALWALLRSSIFGEVDPHDPAVSGYPALFLAAALDQEHRTLFGLTLDRFVEQGLEMSLQARESAGLAVLLAGVHRARPEDPPRRLQQARQCAEQIPDDGRIGYQAMAWASIARSSSDPDDIARARGYVQRATPLYRRADGALELPANENYPDVLSMHLALLHAMADLAQVDPSSGAWRSAIDLLDYVFSDAYFDGEHIMHDHVAGRASSFCSGCNFFALYLADRLYGDALVLERVPRPTRIQGPEYRWEPISTEELTIVVPGNVSLRYPLDGIELDVEMGLADGSPASGPVRSISLRLIFNQEYSASYTIQLGVGGSVHLEIEQPEMEPPCRVFIDLGVPADQPFTCQLDLTVEKRVVGAGLQD